jgi:hydrogenase maturation protease
MCSASAAEAVLVVGLGNPLLGDDGVGWRVVEALEERLRVPADTSPTRGPVETERLAVGGLTLMERLVGYRRAILVDALTDEGERPGTVSCQSLTDAGARAASHLDSAHDAPLPAALAAGRSLGAPLPATITVVGIATRPSDTFDEALSAPVAAAVPVAVARVLALLSA